MKLARLLEEATTASPATRIEWRDRIAAYGPEAIEGVRPWLSNPLLAAFAIRVIERAGAAGETTLAAQVLRSARATVPPAAAGDVQWALQRLRVASQPTDTNDGSSRGVRHPIPLRPVPSRRRSSRPGAR